MAPALAWGGAAAAVALPTGLSLLLDGIMSPAGLALVYLVAVVLAGVALPRWAGIAAAVACVCALNYFFIPPRGTFHVESPEWWWTLAVLLGVSAGVGALVTSLRRRRREAEEGRERAGQLHALSEVLASTRGKGEPARAAADWLHGALGMPCVVYVKESGGLQAWYAPAASSAFQEGLVQWALDNGRPAGRGTEDWGNLPLWCAPFSRHGAKGAVQFLLAGTEPPPRETRDHWLALVRQAGMSIERERAATQAQAASDAARSEAARNTLLASLSHDLRTPLAGILGSASALREHGDAMAPGERARLLGNLETEARDMALMADNVLQMARLSQPEWKLDMQWESVEDILGAAAARMRRRWPGAQIRLHLAAGLPPVRAEAALLAQAVANLVDNAVRHSPEGPARIDLQAGKSRLGVFIAVRDHGAGLPAGDAGEFFERYRPGPGSGGAGLGLAICRLAAQAHGGTIAAKRCEPGTEFRIDLPAQEPAP